MNSEISISIKDSPISEILEKCLENKSISKDDALCLLESKDIISILKLSSLLKTRFKKDVITYSRKIFINIFHLRKTLYIIKRRHHCRLILSNTQ